ncbi:hypothetical protein [Sphingomonas sp. LHG3406-1]|uniref:hypothetical protein n=1 Tax=Sphingomonas sp. LHG3406-1 TaxID=2804617 RepID=UPI0026223875|nr:hypothetical protein [Sphingomonas sp. LHG3406-1]
MIIGIAFWTLTLASCTYASWRGGTDGRIVAILILGASLLSIPAADTGAAFVRTEHGILVVDFLLLIGLAAMAMRSERYFILWVTGFHLVAVASHLSTVVAPDFTPRIYRALSSFWALPIALVMFFGIRADHRSGLLRSSTTSGEVPGE